MRRGESYSFNSKLLYTNGAKLQDAITIVGWLHNKNDSTSSMRS